MTQASSKIFKDGSKECAVCYNKWDNIAVKTCILKTVTVKVCKFMK